MSLDSPDTAAFLTTAELPDRRDAGNRLSLELKISNALATLSRHLMSDDFTIEAMAGKVLEVSLKVSASRHGYVGEIDPDTKDLVAHTLTDMMGRECSITALKDKIVFPPDPDLTFPKLWGVSLNTRQGFFTNDPQNHPSSGGTPEGHIPIERYLSVPVIIGGELVGQIGLANADHPYDHYCLKNVSRIAELFAIAIRNKRSKEKILESERLYQDLYDNAPDMLASVDSKTTHIVRCNQTLIDKTGFSKEEIIHHPIFDLYHPSCRNKSREIFKQFQTTGSVQNAELVFRTKDGSKLWVILNVTSVRDRQGHIHYSRSSWRDITKHKKAETIIREREEKIRLLLEATGEGIFETDLHGNFTLVNRACLKLLGYDSPGELLGKNAHQLIHCTTRNGPHHPVKDCPILDPISKATGIHGDGEIFFRKNGTHFPVEFHSYPILRYGKNIGFVVNFSDISDRMRIQEETQRSLAEKEALLKEVHHRVKNNIQIISGLLQLQASRLKKKKASKKNALAALEASRDRIRSMAQIHERLYRSENLSRVNLADYIQELATNLFLSYGAKEKNIRLKLTLSPVFLKIEQAIPCGLILNELISNSLKHAFNKKGGTIKILLCQIINNWIDMTVIDNGSGFDFDLDSPRDGSLGIQLVKTLVRQLNGEVNWKNNQPGTRVRVRYLGR
ncbi:MAG: PAS domain S-box protein [Magnetococcales bacterium]|nr:PAS domain S-box protein [Magnetococcales bacterium]